MTFSVRLDKHSSFFDPEKFLVELLKNSPDRTHELDNRYKFELITTVTRNWSGSVTKLELRVQDLQNTGLGFCVFNAINRGWGGGPEDVYLYESRSTSNGKWTIKQKKEFGRRFLDFLEEEQSKVLKERSRKLAKERKERNKKKAIELGLSEEELKAKKSLERKNKRRKKKTKDVSEYITRTTKLLRMIDEQMERLQGFRDLLIENMELANNMQNPGHASNYSNFNQKFTWKLNSSKDDLKRRIKAKLPDYEFKN